MTGEADGLLLPEKERLSALPEMPQGPLGSLLLVGVPSRAEIFLCRVEIFRGVHPGEISHVVIAIGQK